MNLSKQGKEGHMKEKEKVVLKHQLKHQPEVELEIHPLMIGNLLKQNN